MKRRTFVQRSASVALGALGSQAGLTASTGESVVPLSGPVENGNPFPLAITMWEFSWLERRWPGAGYEDWDEALSGLVERGYDAVRIDPFPHLVSNDPEKEYLLLPHWSVQDWGSPGINRVRVQPGLNQFLEKCREYGVVAGLSSWFREDEDDLRMRLDTPEKLGHAWLDTLKTIERDHLMDTILYVDLCNEWTGPAWCPFFVNDPPQAIWTGWDTEKSRDWMRKAISPLKAEYPMIPFTFSFTGEVNRDTLGKKGFHMLDFLEPHIWMTSFNGGEYYDQVGYGFERFDINGYRNLALHGKEVYEKRKQYWQEGLKEQIGLAAQWSRQEGLPLITTECWGLVDFKDHPLLDWGYVKELCALGTRTAAGTGRWLAMATSNFCGPQFTGMWRDAQWHRQLTDAIHRAPVSGEIRGSLLASRMKEIRRRD